jgi:hypothetical protein
VKTARNAGPVTVPADDPVRDVMGRAATGLARAAARIVVLKATAAAPAAMGIVHNGQVTDVVLAGMNALPNNDANRLRRCRKLP